MIKMDYKGKITNQEIPLFEGNNAYLRDFAISNDEDAPITAGLFRLEKGDSITYEYTYEEMKLIIDGEFHISDGSGEEVTATAGDLFYFPKGSVITFRTYDHAAGFFGGVLVDTGTAEVFAKASRSAFNFPNMVSAK